MNTQLVSSEQRNSVWKGTMTWEPEEGRKLSHWRAGLELVLAGSQGPRDTRLQLTMGMGRLGPVWPLGLTLGPWDDWLQANHLRHLSFSHHDHQNMANFTGLLYQEKQKVKGSSTMEKERTFEIHTTFLQCTIFVECLEIFVWLFRWILRAFWTCETLLTWERGLREVKELAQVHTGSKL